MTAGSLSLEDAKHLVGSAILAPSVLNTQPWLFHGHGEVINVHADASRMLPVIDPTGRAAMISCAAATFNLRLAIQASGRQPVVHLLPDVDDALHVARVGLTGPAEMTTAERTLYQAIPNRRTNRLPFRDERLPVEVVSHLEEAADAEGGILRVLTSAEVPDVVKTVHEADRVQRANPEVRAEVGRWTNRPPGDRDGLTTSALGPRPRDPSAVVRDFAFGYPVPGRETAAFEKMASLAVLYTYGDTRMDWLRAGMALQRVLLTATALDVATSLLTQALEVASLRWLLRIPALGVVAPQAMLRLGYGVPVHPSPRRPVGDVLRYTP